MIGRSLGLRATKVLAGAIEVDVAQFLSLLRTSDAHASDHRSWRTCTPCADRLRQALALYRGNFLADFFIPDSSVFEEWAALQREHLLQRGARPRARRPTHTA